MICAIEKCVYAILLGLFIGSPNIAVYGKVRTLPDAGKDTLKADYQDQFQWAEHSKLSWDDFKGAVNAANDASAAATYCGIGIKTNNCTREGKPEIVIYNTFYTKKSWVREDARIASILEHEQGHFDLCEIYTRKLRQRVCNLDLNMPNAKQALIDLYTEVSNEYENRQRAYEQETVHGTDIMQQKKWLEMISNELYNVQLIAFTRNQ